MGDPRLESVGTLSTLLKKKKHFYINLSSEVNIFWKLIFICHHQNRYSNLHCIGKKATKLLISKENEKGVKRKMRTWRIITAATNRNDHATKWDVLISIDPSSSKTSLRTTQKPNQAPARTTRTRRNVANCSLNFHKHYHQWLPIMPKLNVKTLLMTRDEVQKIIFSVKTLNQPMKD